MAEKEVRKTTTKKAVRKTTTKTTPASSVERSTVRKAPARIAKIEEKKQSSAIVFMGGGALFLVLLGVSALIGFSDKGQLDVEGKITERKQSATPEEQEILKSVPTEQSKNSVPNGGLVGTGDSEPVPVPVIEAATTTESAATTTEEGQTVASSTEEVVADDAAAQ